MMSRLTAGLFTVGLLTAALSLPSPVHAGAWTLPEGQGQAIFSGSRTIAPVRAWFGGVSNVDQNSTGIFLEYGVWDDLTVGLSLSSDYSSTFEEIDARIAGRVRHRVWAGQAGDVFSVQGEVRLPIERLLGNGIGDQRPNSATEVDLRALYGKSWQWGLGNSFASGELGLRIRSEGLDEQLRFDATVGHEPTRGVLLLGSMFSSFPLGNKDEVSIKLSPSVAYTRFPLLGPNDKKPWQPISPDTLQISVTWDAARPGSGLEFGVSLWTSF